MEQGAQTQADRTVRPGNELKAFSSHHFGRMIQKGDGAPAPWCPAVLNQGEDHREAASAVKGDVRAHNVLDYDRVVQSQSALDNLALSLDELVRGGGRNQDSTDQQECHRD